MERWRLGLSTLLVATEFFELRPARGTAAWILNLSGTPRIFFGQDEIYICHGGEVAFRKLIERLLVSAYG